MTAEVPNVLAQIAAIERQIINVETGAPLIAFDNVPYIINVADMPLFVNYVGNLTQNVVAGSDEIARDMREVRNYTLAFYMGAYGTGVEGELIARMTPYFPLIYARFGSYPHLNMLAGVVDSTLVGDSGTKVLQFAGHQYHGVLFTLQVMSKVRRPFADME